MRPLPAARYVIEAHTRAISLSLSPHSSESAGKLHGNKFRSRFSIPSHSANSIRSDPITGVARGEKKARRLESNAHARKTSIVCRYRIVRASRVSQILLYATCNLTLNLKYQGGRPVESNRQRNPVRREEEVKNVARRAARIDESPINGDCSFFRAGWSESLVWNSFLHIRQNRSRV